MKALGRKNEFWLVTGALLTLAAVCFAATAWLEGGLWLSFGLVAAIAFLLVAVLAYAAGFAMLSGAPYVPVSRSRLATMIELAELKPGEKLVDLGSGDGRVLRAAARVGARAEGWEISPYLWLWSEAIARLCGLGDRVETRLGSYWNQSFHDVDVVTIYLLPSHMSRMGEKLRTELKPGTRVISAAFTFDGWQPVREVGGVFLYLI